MQGRFSDRGVQVVKVPPNTYAHQTQRSPFSAMSTLGMGLNAPKFQVPHPVRFQGEGRVCARPHLGLHPRESPVSSGCPQSSWPLEKQPG